jgi:hypothetical protein
MACRAARREPGSGVRTSTKRTRVTMPRRCRSVRYSNVSRITHTLLRGGVDWFETAGRGFAEPCLEASLKGYISEILVPRSSRAS